MKSFSCPLCNGKGKIKIGLEKKYNPDLYRDHPNRKLPFHYFCKKHNKYVTKLHHNSYLSCRGQIFNIKTKEKQTSSDTG